MRSTPSFLGLFDHGRLWTLLWLSVASLSGSAKTFEFDSASEMTNFTVYVVRGSYGFNSEPGVGGEAGRLDVRSGGFTIFDKVPVQLTLGTSIRIGAFFQYRPDTQEYQNLYPIRVGLSSSMRGVHPSDAFDEYLAGGVNRLLLSRDEVLFVSGHLDGQFGEAIVHVPLPEPPAGLYQINTSWTWLGGDEFDATVQLLFYEDGLGLGPGTELGLLRSVIRNAQIASAPQLYAGFQPTAVDVIYLDNLSIEIIPEPATLELSLIAALACALTRALHRRERTRPE